MDRLENPLGGTLPAHDPLDFPEVRRISPTGKRHPQKAGHIPHMAFVLLGIFLIVLGLGGKTMGGRQLAHPVKPSLIVIFRAIAIQIFLQ